MVRALFRGFVLIAMVAAGLAIDPWRANAEHESTNVLTFASATDAPLPDATGDGVIEFNGLTDPQATRWTATFSFAGLEPGASYTVVVQGRFGDDGTTDATAWTPICAFQAGAGGIGGCWHYFVELRRLGVVQLRQGDGDGLPVLQATRAADQPGIIESVPNPFSPAPTPAPTTSPVASPGSGSDADPEPRRPSFH
ncbi:MAG: hypothetical protein H0W06_11320 [Chloroflexia bacterium]|nr:hypothetical protein [Chloroflexia bacterium]